VGVLRGVGLVGAELVVVVVGGRLGEGCLRIGDGIFAGNGGQRLIGVDGGWMDEAGDALDGERAEACCGNAGDEVAAIEEGFFRGDLRGGDLAPVVATVVLDEHVDPSRVHRQRPSSVAGPFA